MSSLTRAAQQPLPTSAAVSMEQAQQAARTVPFRLKLLAQARIASLAGGPF